MPSIDIHVNGVTKLLRGLKAHKATGPDEVSARLLKEAADQLAPILTTIFRASYQQATVPEDSARSGGKPTKSPFSKRVTMPLPPTTDQCL